MPATNPLTPKSSYNNVKIEYLTPQTSKNIYVADNANYPSSGSSYFTFDGTNRQILVDKIYNYTAAAGVRIESVLLNDGSVRLENNCVLKGVNAAGSSEIDIVKINASNKLEFNSSLDVNWETYTPTVTPSGSMTFSGTYTWGTSGTNWLFWRIGDLVLFKGIARGTIGGSVSTYFDCTLPVTAGDADQYFDVMTFENGSPTPGYAYLTSTTNLRVFKAGATAWVAGANSGFIFTGAWYRAA